jgi:predicted ATPase
MVQTLSTSGEFIRALEHCEQGNALYDPQRHRSLAFHSGQDPRVACLSFAAWNLWLLGYPDQALRRSREAVALARELSHPLSLGFALDFAAWLHQFRRERKLTQELAEEGIAISTDQGLPFWRELGVIMQGWALAAQGQEEGIALMRRGLTAWQAMGTEVGSPYFLALLAEGYGKGGQAKKGLEVLAEAIATVQRNGERNYEAELYRLKGKLLLQSNAQHCSEAEPCFQRALSIARSQSAKSLELRAAMSLSRLWQQQGKKDEARQMLAEIYGWFTEGFDTKDLQDAKALLDELS